MSIQSQPSTPMVDLHFQVRAREIPQDHGYPLYAAIKHALEWAAGKPAAQWLEESDQVGLLPIRGNYLGRGRLAPGPRASFALRLPAGEIPRLLPLAGRTLLLQGLPLTVGVPTPQALIPSGTLHAHLVTTKHGDDEQRFDAEVRHQLETLAIGGLVERGSRKILRIRDKRVVGHALTIRGLTADESIRLQCLGLGGRRKMGAGVFLPARTPE